ncbi:glycoside hydrolase family 93 protein [Xylariaceae sp. FL0016]|nr:glycoside hydrolase family 93 protein [Xylariaceae sp. FL0016]
MTLRSLLFVGLSLFSLSDARPLDGTATSTQQSSPQIRRLGDQRRSRDTLEGVYARDTEEAQAIDATVYMADDEIEVAAQGAYPRLAQLSDDSILAVTARSDSDFRVISTTRSTDQGATFSPLGEVTRSDTADIDNAFLLPLPSGKILCAFRNHDQNEAGNYTWYRITVAQSDDNGKSWTYLTQAAEHAATDVKNGIWEPFMRIGKNGEIQMTYSGELEDDNQETFRIISTDEGKTWTEPKNLRLHSTDEHFRDGMQSIVPFQLADGTDALIMVFETVKTDHFLIEYVVSYDDGETWGCRGEVYNPPQRNAGSPYITKIGDNLAVIFGTDKDVTEEHSPWNSKADSVIVFSPGLVQNRLSWSSEPLVVSERPSFWPSVLGMENGSIMALYERDVVARGRIISVGEN